MAGGPIRIAVFADAKDAVAGFKATGAAAERMAKQAEASSSRASKFGSTMKLAFAGIAGAVAASKVKDFLSDSIAEARESQKVGALTAQVIKTTGHAANISAAQVGNLATAISNKTGIDDEAIQSASNLLLTFTAVHNEMGRGNKVFNEATRLATDMAAALGGDAKSAALQLGKALNDPEKGVTKLARSGVSFTEQQVEQIKAMQKAGDVLGAQKIILGEVSKEFGGAAAASSTAGEKMSVAWGNLKEQVGTALLPVLDKAETAITKKVIPAVSTFISQMQDGTGAGGKFAGELKKVGTVVTDVVGWMDSHRGVVAAFIAGFAAYKTVNLFAGAIRAVNLAMKANTFGLVVAGVAAVAAGLIYAYKHSEKFRAIVDGAFRAVKAAGSAMWDALKSIFKFLVNAWLIVAGAIVNGAAKAFGWVPGIGPKLKGAAAAFNGFRDSVNASLSGIHKDVSVTVHAQLTGAAALNSLLNPKKLPRTPSTSLPSSGNPLRDLLGPHPRTAVGASTDAMTALMPRAAATSRKAATVSLKSFVDGIKAGIPKVKRQAKAISDLLSDAVADKKQTKKIKDALGKMTDAIKAGLDKQVGITQAAVDKIKDRINGYTTAAGVEVEGLKPKVDRLTEAYNALADAVSQNFSPTFDTNALTGPDGKTIAGSAVSSFNAQLAEQKATLDQSMAAYRKLLGEGLNGDWLQSLYASGNTGLILDLAKGSKSEALSAQQSYQQVQAEAKALGEEVANNTTTKTQLDTATTQLGVAQQQLDVANKHLASAKAQETKLHNVNTHLKDIKADLKGLPKTFARELNQSIAAANKGRRS